MRKKNKKNMEKWGYFQHEKYRYHIARLLYFSNSLRSAEEDLGDFSTPKEALKVVFGVCFIRVFSQFSLDPYHEPLL